MVPSSASAKHYLLKRDASTGKTIIVDPSQSTLSKITSPVLSPLARTFGAVKNYVVGKPARRSAVPGFNNRPVSQAEMQAPSKSTMMPQFFRRTVRSADAGARAIGAGPLVRATSNMIRDTSHSITGAEKPRRVSNTSAIYRTASTQGVSSAQVSPTIKTGQ